MTGSERQQLRALIDQRRRELADDDQPRCASCGCDHDTYSRGCRSCLNRKHARQLRARGGPPLERERERDRNRKRRRHVPA